MPDFLKLVGNEPEVEEEIPRSNTSQFFTQFSRSAAPPQEYTPEQLKEYGTITEAQPPGVLQKIGLGPVASMTAKFMQQYGIKPKVLSFLGAEDKEPSTVSTLLAGALPDLRSPRQGEQSVLDPIMEGVKSIPTGEAIEETVGEAKKGDVGSIASLALTPLWLGKTGVNMLKAPIKAAGKIPAVVDRFISSNPLYERASQVGASIWDKAKQPMNYLIEPSMSLTDKSGSLKRLDDVLGNLPSATVTAFQKLGGKGVETIQEKLQPAIERLGGNQQGVFRRGRAMENLFVNEMEILGREITQLDLPDRLDVLRGLRGEQYSKLSKRASDILIDSNRRMASQKLDPMFIQKANESFSNLLTKVLKAPENVLTDPIARELLEEASIEAKNPQAWGRFFTRGSRTRSALARLIESPAVTDETRTLAKSIYELPATTPEMATKAGREASNMWITGKLLNLKGADSPFSLVPKRGYIPVEDVKWTGLPEGHFIDKDVALELTSLRDAEKWSRTWVNKFITAPWKTMKIIMSPAAQIRNTFTNLLLNDIGGLPIYRMDIYKDALKGMRKESREWKDFVRTTGGGGTFSRNDLSALEGVWKYDTPWYEVPYRFLDMASRIPKSVYNMNEQLSKFAFYLHELEKGVPKQKAAWNALKPTFNYGEVTPTVGFARSTFAPFATWTSKVIPYTFEMAAKHPLRVGKWFAFFQMAQQHALEQAGLTDGEWERFRSKWPEYLQRGQYLLLPWRDDKDRLNMLDLTYVVPGLGDMAQLTGQGIWPSVFQHPVTTLPGQLLANKKFTGEPITYDWKPGSVQAINYASHIWESLMPTWFGPWGADWKRYEKAMSDEPGAQTVGQAISAQFGLRIQPLDKQKMYSMNSALRRIHLTEMTTDMNKQLRRATSPEEKRKVIETYRKYRQDFLREELAPKKSFLESVVD